MRDDSCLGAPRRAWLRAPEGGWWRFESPVAGRVAGAADEVPGLLAWVEESAGRGLWAVGYVAYEAAPAFDPALAVHAAGEGPMAAFGLFAPPQRLELPASSARLPLVAAFEPAIREEEHGLALATIRAAIARGETYQVNFTFPLRGHLRVSPEELFFALAPLSGAPGAAFLDLGERAIVSLSPELFFERDGERLRMRPMKGTRRRGRFPEEDARRAAELGDSEKDRAENLMIVDMARNDLGRVAEPGSVRVAGLFDVERYPTVWQMTSTVEARSAAGLAELFAALFPCASVTGAPKASTMGWIARLEREPRGIYCGAIGWVAPAERARFAVAIRTAVCARANGALDYRVGSGIVWDSDPAEEWAECLAKGLALSADPERFDLIETFRVSTSGRCHGLGLHLDRLLTSAAHFGFAADRRTLLAALDAHLSGLPAGAVPADRRVRLTLAPDGTCRITSEPFARARGRWRLHLAPSPVDSRDPFLFHKTTRRAVYDAALAAARAAGADEAVLWNERGELTEGTRTNLLLRLDGRWLTPAREGGLLAGVGRERLLRAGRIAEAVLPIAALECAERVLLVSSLRGLLEPRKVGPGPAEGDRLSCSNPSTNHSGPEER